MEQASRLRYNPYRRREARWTRSEAFETKATTEGSGNRVVLETYRRPLACPFE